MSKIITKLVIVTSIINSIFTISLFLQFKNLNDKFTVLNDDFNLVIPSIHKNIADINKELK